MELIGLFADMNIPVSLLENELTEFSCYENQEQMIQFEAWPEIIIFLSLANLKVHGI